MWYWLLHLLVVILVISNCGIRRSLATDTALRSSLPSSHASISSFVVFETEEEESKCVNKLE